MELENHFIREQLNDIKWNLNRDYLNVSCCNIFAYYQKFLICLVFKLVPYTDDFFIAVAFTQWRESLNEVAIEFLKTFVSCSTVHTSFPIPSYCIHKFLKVFWIRPSFKIVFFFLFSVVTFVNIFNSVTFLRRKSVIYMGKSYF